MNPLNAYLAQSVLEERYAQAERYRRSHPERTAAAPALYDAVTIRRVTPDDWQAVEHLSELDGRQAPAGAALLAEVDDRVLVVRSLEDGATVADPFHHTAELVRLLEARAKQLGGAAPSVVTRPLRRAAARVTALARH
jgi:hypothetical protein